MRPHQARRSTPGWWIILLGLSVAGCVGHETQRNEYHATLGPWVHQVAINESVTIAPGTAYYVPFSAQNRTVHDAVNASYAYALFNGSLLACIFPASAGQAWDAQAPTQGAGCASGATGEATGIPLTNGSYTLGLRCNAPHLCRVRYSLRTEGTGESTSKPTP